MSWQRFRLGTFALIGTAFLIVGAFVQRVGVEQASRPLLATFASLAVLMAVVVVIDVVYHAWRGKGQACRHCGHLRRMKPFQIYVGCPNCGAS